MDTTLKVYKDGVGNLYAIDQNGFKTSVLPGDFRSLNAATQLKGGECLTVRTNNHSTILKDSFTSIEGCSYKFNINK